MSHVSQALRHFIDCVTVPDPRGSSYHHLSSPPILRLLVVVVVVVKHGFVECNLEDL